MFKSKYSTFLTIALIVVIVAIIIITTILIINTYKNYEDEKEKERVIAEFIPIEDTEDIKEGTNNNLINGNEIGNITVEPIIGNVVGNTTISGNNNSNTSSRPKVKYYNNYPAIGTIKIDKTNIEYPILLDGSPGALETSVGITYPLNAELNKPGNVVIIGHNYRNGKFFSNNKKLSTGDKIRITDLLGTTLIYTIYEIFETSKNDTEYYTRDRGENIEISLVTCTDNDENTRLVILARVQ